MIEKLTPDTPRNGEQKQTLLSGRLLLGVCSEEVPRVQLTGEETMCKLIGPADWILFSTEPDSPPPPPGAAAAVQSSDLQEILDATADPKIPHPVPEPSAAGPGLVPGLGLGGLGSGPAGPGHESFS